MNNKSPKSFPKNRTASTSTGKSLILIASLINIDMTTTGDVNMIFESNIDLSIAYPTHFVAVYRSGTVGGTPMIFVKDEIGNSLTGKWFLNPDADTNAFISNSNGVAGVMITIRDDKRLVLNISTSSGSPYNIDIFAYGFYY